MDRKPYAFFYGGYMDERLLREAGVQPENCEAGYIEGFALTVGPLANLREEADARAYGLLAQLSHRDLDMLYAGDPSHLKGAKYLPEAVLVHTVDGGSVPALTYICPNLPYASPDPAYLEKLIEAAQSLDLPAECIDHIRSFMDAARAP